MPSQKKELLIFIALLLFGLCFAFSSTGIFFEVSNSKLEADIDQLSEEKENLRARYLSRIALAKLDRQASRLKMQHADASTSYTVSKSQSKKTKQTLEQNLRINNLTEIVSGY